jgi:hypothetical protein
MASDNTITDLITCTRAIQSESDSDSANSFFSTFPREIRDQIYDLIFQENTYPIHFDESGHKAFYSKIRTTVSKVRLVCSRFKIEYDERDKHHLPKNHFRVCQVDLNHLTSGPHVFGFKLVVPKLAIRTTVLHLDLKCCQDTQDPAKCLIPADGSTHGIGGSQWLTYNPRFVYDIADLPLLKKACIHISCAAKKRAVDPLPPSEPSAKTPMLAQISLFHDVYVQDPAQSDSVRSDGPGPEGASRSQCGGLLVRRQRKTVWTHVNGWDNEANMDLVRAYEMCLGEHGIVFF